MSSILRIASLTLVLQALWLASPLFAQQKPDDPHETGPRRTMPSDLGEDSRDKGAGDYGLPSRNAELAEIGGWGAKPKGRWTISDKFGAVVNSLSAIALFTYAGGQFHAGEMDHRALIAGVLGSANVIQCARSLRRVGEGP